MCKTGSYKWSCIRVSVQKRTQILILRIWNCGTCECSGSDVEETWVKFSFNQNILAAGVKSKRLCWILFYFFRIAAIAHFTRAPMSLIWGLTRNFWQEWAKRKPCFNIKQNKVFFYYWRDKNSKSLKTGTTQIFQQLQFSFSFTKFCSILIH